MMDILDGKMTEEVYKSLIEKIDDLKKGIENQKATILNNNAELRNSNVPTSSYEPLIGDMSSYDFNQSMRFEQLVDLFHELKEIALNKKAIIENQEKDMELIKDGANNIEAKPISEDKKTKGEGLLSTDGIFNKETEEIESLETEESLSSGLNNIF